MKPFLGIDLTTDKKNEQVNGISFLISQPSSSMAQALEKSSQKAEETIEHSKLPRVIRILQFVCGATGILFVSSILKADVSLAEGYQNAPWVFWTAGICLLVWLVLKLLSGQKTKSVFGKEENARVFSNLESISNSIYAELAVPYDAKEVDILSFFYKLKDGNVKVCEKGLQIASYLNPVFKIFSDSDNLYIANLEGKYAFPRSSIQTIRTVNKKINMIGWNKSEAFNKGDYKKYKLTSDNYGRIHCKPYYILEINHSGEIWGIYFPCYELPVFEALTGLKAE